jgi:hypothetical protein
MRHRKKVVPVVGVICFWWGGDSWTAEEPIPYVFQVALVYLWAGEKFSLLVY